MSRVTYGWIIRVYTRQRSAADWRARRVATQLLSAANGGGSRDAHPAPAHACLQIIIIGPVAWHGGAARHNAARRLYTQRPLLRATSYAALPLYAQLSLHLAGFDLEYIRLKLRSVYLELSRPASTFYRSNALVRNRSASTLHILITQFVFVCHLYINRKSFNIYIKI